MISMNKMGPKKGRGELLHWNLLNKIFKYLLKNQLARKAVTCLEAFVQIMIPVSLVASQYWGPPEARSVM